MYTFPSYLNFLSLNSTVGDEEPHFPTTPKKKRDMRIYPEKVKG